jgi:hypothetical protein
MNAKKTSGGCGACALCRHCHPAGDGEREVEARSTQEETLAAGARVAAGGAGLARLSPLLQQENARA